MVYAGGEKEMLKGGVERRRKAGRKKTKNRKGTYKFLNNIPCHWW